MSSTVITWENTIETADADTLRDMITAYQNHITDKKASGDADKIMNFIEFVGSDEYSLS